MSDETRDRLRNLQDRWLQLPVVRRFEHREGTQTPITDGGPTLDQVKTTLLPQWESWFAEWLKP